MKFYFHCHDLVLSYFDVKDGGSVDDVVELEFGASSLCLFSKRRKKDDLFFREDDLLRKKDDLFFYA